MNYVEKFDSGSFGGQGSSPGLRDSFSVDVHAKGIDGSGGADTVIVPDAQLLFGGDYKRSGLDLVLSKDGHEHLVRDYFRGEHRATLASPDGASLSGTTVGALAGQVDYAQAGGDPAPAQIIGHVTKLTGSATAIRNGVSITLNMGDNVHKGDVVQSGAESSLGLTFIDGTVFGLSSNARMVLNEMVYDPSSSNNSSLLTLVQGTISFVAGATAKHGDMKVETPTATMGIRGTAVLVEIDFDLALAGITPSVSLPGVAPPVSFRVLVEPNGVTGEYVLLDKLTLQPIATVNQPGSQTIVNGHGVVTFIQSAQISSDAQRLITDIFALKFTDANPKDLGIPPLDSITPQTFIAKLTDGTPINLTMIFVNVLTLDPLAGAPPSGGNHRFHLDIPPELVVSSNHFTERFLTTGNGALDTISGSIRFADINPEDLPTVTARFDSFVYRDAGQTIVTSSLTAEQLAAIGAVEVPLSVIADSGNTNIGGATWTYGLADQAFDFLAAGETLTLTYMARVDTNYSEYNTVVLRPFTITITGTNDLPTVAATGSAFIERLGTNNTAIDHAEGVITFADVDLTDRPTVTAPFSSYVYTAAGGSPLTLTPAQEAAIEAALTLTPAATNAHNGSVAWSYDVADRDFDFIAAGETLTLTYTAIVDDHHGGVVSVPLTVTVTVHGTNDIPTITASSDGFIELAGTGNTTLDHAGGTIAFTDVDLTDRPAISSHFTSFTYQNALHADVTSTLTAQQQAAISAVEAALTLTPSPANANNGSVVWSYDLADSRFDFLAAGETLTLSYTATVDDHHGGVVSTPITVTVTGTNDVPTIVTTNDAITELAGTNIATPDHAGGSITFTDVDLTDRPTVTAPVSSYTYFAADGHTALALTSTQQTALEATLTLTPSLTNANNGSVTWSYDLPDNQFDFLAAGETVALTYIATVDDHHGGSVSTPVTVTIHGTNDAPDVAADASGPLGSNLHAITEIAATTGDTADLDIASGSLAFTDVDLTDTHTVGNVLSSATWSGGGTLPVGLAAILATALSTSVAADSTDTGTGSVGFTFSAADNNFDFLADGETLTVTYDVTVTDNNHVTSTQPVTVTITGTNDAPVVAAALTDSANEGDAAFTTNLLTGATDVDHGETATLSVASLAYAVDGGTASATLPAGISLGLDGHTLTIDPTDPAFDHLAVGEQTVITVSYDVTDAQGATVPQTETITVHGANDAPVVAAALTDNANEGDTAFTTNLLTGATDVDHGETATLSVASLAYVVDGGTASATPPAGISLGLDGHTLTVDPANPAFDYLAVGEQTVITVSYDVTDAQSATVPQTETITIHGTNDAPVVAAALTDSANEGDTAFTTNLLTGATDVDHGETATLSVASLAYVVDGGTASATPPAGISLGGDGHTLTVDPTDPAFDHLAFGQQTVITVSFDVTDAQGATVPQTETVTIHGSNDAPAISTAGLYVSGTGPTTVSGLSVSDVDATPSETFTISAVTAEAASGSHVTPAAGTGTLTAINAVLNSGIVYDPGATPPQTDMVTLTVTDGLGASDTVNFIFNVAGSGPVTLSSTSGNDVLFGTGYADQFVFAASSNHDTIIGFTAGTDHIDLSALASIVDSSNINTFLTNNVTSLGTDTLITLDSNDSIILRNVASSTLHAGDFLVHA